VKNLEGNKLVIIEFIVLLIVFRGYM